MVAAAAPPAKKHPGTTATTTLVVVAALLLVLLTMVLPRAPQSIWMGEKGNVVHVAFIGNSIMFVNDLPRFFQALSGDRIYQNSCLHGSLSFATLLQYGNGMYQRWSTENAQINDNVTSDVPVYDYGACTVKQLLFGEDDDLSSTVAQEEDNDGDGDNDENNDNDGAVYADDGKNPCLVDPNYFDYLQQQETYSSDNPPHWDYIIMNDKTSYPGDYYSRQSSIEALEQSYADMLVELGSRTSSSSGRATPVFLVTYGYIKTSEATDDNDDASHATLGNVSVFTSRVHYGYQLYAQQLQHLLGPEQQPILAPVGLSFLTIWEESYGIWKRLFFFDGYHPSPHGTYVIGLVVYASLFNRMPPTEFALSEDFVRLLWSRARAMQLETSDEYPTMPFPTLDEANYLFRVCKRVVLQGHRPASFLTYEQVEELELMEYNCGSSQ